MAGGVYRIAEVLYHGLSVEEYVCQESRGLGVNVEL